MVKSTARAETHGRAERPEDDRDREREGEKDSVKRDKQGLNVFLLQRIKKEKKKKACLRVGIGFVSFSDSQNDPDVAVTGPSSAANICCLFTLAGGGGVEEQPVGGPVHVGPLFRDSLSKDCSPYGMEWESDRRIRASRELVGKRGFFFLKKGFHIFSHCGNDSETIDG